MEDPARAPTSSRTPRAASRAIPRPRSRPRAGRPAACPRRTAAGDGVAAGGFVGVADGAHAPMMPTTSATMTSTDKRTRAPHSRSADPSRRAQVIRRAGRAPYPRTHASHRDRRLRRRRPPALCAGDRLSGGSRRDHRSRGSESRRNRAPGRSGRLAEPPNLPRRRGDAATAKRSTPSSTSRRRRCTER